MYMLCVYMWMCVCVCVFVHRGACVVELLVTATNGNLPATKASETIFAAMAASLCVGECMCVYVSACIRVYVCTRCLFTAQERTSVKEQAL